MRRTISYAGAFLMLFLVKVAQAQNLVVNAFIPPGALIQKEQLWNVIIVNPGSGVHSCQLSLTILNKANGTKMLTAITNTIVVPGGTRQIQVADVMPVAYNALNENVHLSSHGFLPVGLYQVCYEAVGDKGQSYGSSCIDVQVEVLAPPQLIFPENKSEIKEQHPVFNWIPPAPATLVPNCTYEYKIVKVGKNQTGADAINDNVPVFRTGKLPNTAFNYPPSATALDKQQLYAWQITAQSAGTDIKSDVWTFTITDKDETKAPSVDGNAYTKLAKNNEKSSYTVVPQVLKFSWYNESLDSIFQLRVLDVTGGNHLPVTINDKAVPIFSTGSNLIELDLSKAGKFVRNHMYEFCVIDKQGQEWKMLFEYKKK